MSASPNEFNIGSVANLQGSAPGLKLASDLAIAGVSAYASHRIGLRANAKAAKDFNDQPTTTTVGTDSGKPVRSVDPVDTSWQPPL